MSARTPDAVIGMLKEEHERQLVSLGVLRTALENGSNPLLVRALIDEMTTGARRAIAKAGVK